MADYNSSLPVRTEAAGDVIVKVGDATTPSQQLAVDASGRVIAKIQASNGDALTDTSGSLNVNVTNAIATGTADQSTFTYGSSTQTTIGGVFQDTSPTLTAGQSGAVRLTSQRGMHMNLRTAAGVELLGQAAMAGSVPVVIASNQSAIATTDTADGPVTPGTVAANSQLGGLQYNTAAPAPTNGQQVALQGDSSANLKVNLATALPAGSNLIGNVNVFSGGTANSVSNPLYVTETAAGGTSIDSYQTSATLAANATANLDYTVTAAKTFYCQQLWATGSGKIKVVLAFETAPASGTYTTFWVGFNSTSSPNILIPLPPAKTQVAGAKIRVAITNRDNQSQDIYETLSGNEV